MTALPQTADASIDMGTLLNDADSSVSIPLDALLSQHIGVSGGSGLGKSFLSESIFRQIITLPHDKPIPGAAIFDPNGDLVNRLLLFIRENPGKVHPQVIENLCVLEPSSEILFSLDPFDPSYYAHVPEHRRPAWIESQAERVALGIIRARGEHSFENMPRLEKWMKTLLIVAGTPINEAGDHFPLGDLHVLYDTSHPQYPAAYRVIRPHLSDRVRQRFEQLQDLSPQRKEETLDSTISRFESFFSETVRRLFAQESTTLQIPQMVSDGAWVFINLQDVDDFTPERANAVGSVLLSLFLQTVMSRPEHKRRRFILWIDEASRYIAGPDIGKALRESRKYQLTCGLCFQDLSALATDQNDVLRQFLNCRTHFCFGQRAEEDLRLLASVLAFPNLSFEKLRQIGNISLNEYAPVETTQTTRTEESALTHEVREGKQQLSTQRLSQQQKQTRRKAHTHTNEESQADQVTQHRREELTNTDQTEDFQEQRSGIEITDLDELSNSQSVANEIMDGVQFRKQRTKQNEVVLGHVTKKLDENSFTASQRSADVDEKKRTLSNDAQATNRKTKSDRRSDESTNKRSKVESHVKDVGERILSNQRGSSHQRQLDDKTQTKEDQGFEGRNSHIQDTATAAEQSLTQRDSTEQVESQHREQERASTLRDLSATELTQAEQHRLVDANQVSQEHSERRIRTSDTAQKHSHQIKQGLQQAAGQKAARLASKTLAQGETTEQLLRRTSATQALRSLDISDSQALEQSQTYGQHMDWINAQATTHRTTTTVKTDMASISRIIVQDSGRLVDSVSDQLYRYYAQQSMLGVGEVTVAHGSQVVSVNVSHVYQPYDALTLEERFYLLLSVKEAIAAKHPTYFEYSHSEADDQVRLESWLNNVSGQDNEGRDPPAKLPEGF